MPKFIVAVQVKSENGMHVGFLPGDAVPEWALKVVGEHVHDGGAAPEADVEDPVAEHVEGDASATPEADVAPDFTKPAPAKRGRPRKAE